ncbi:MAG: translation initiation factor IF-2 [Candidatus Manganitrophaceae bacterium]
MRVFELAKKIGIPTKEMMALLKKMGIKASNHMSALEESDIQAVLKGMEKASTTKISTKAAKPVKTLPPPPPAEKKSRVLIKRKPTLEEAPLLQATVKEEPLAPETPSIEILKEPTEGEVTLSIPSDLVEPVAPVVPLEVTGLVPPLAPIDAVKAVPPPVGKKGPEIVEKKVEKEKKKGKGDGRGELRKEIAAKLKEKTKRPKREVWEAATEEVDVADVVEAETVPEVAPAPVEARKWQDFKPIHRREERRAFRKGGGATLAEVTKPRRKVVKLHEGMTVKEFSELIGQKVPAIIAKFMAMGRMATINQPVSLDEAALIAEAFGVKTELVSEKTEEEMINQPVAEDLAALVPRPPVITIMGHVDHGKTSLLDAIRQTKVTEGEAGGITQHIGAYTVTVGEKKVTFLDTPGHEAFTAMRARGAKVTDIVILVVAADDGVMPQTIEAINHAKAANVPIIVAINKIDKPDANPDRVKTALAEYELIPEEWGGKTIFAEVSAKKKVGLDHLLEMILLQAEVLELKANPNRPMVGTIVEAKLDRGRGPVATVLVQQGTLKGGDFFVTGVYSGKVRALINDEGKKVDAATPSTPVEVIGLDGVPQAGDTFLVVSDERIAKEVAHGRAQRQRLSELALQTPRVTLDDLYHEIREGTVKELSIIVKADVQGSAEAIKEALEKLGTAAVKLRVIHRGVGSITESDVLLASASNAIIIGFSVRPEPKAQDLAEREKVDLRLYTIIYDAIADVKAAMEGLLEPTFKEKTLGRIEIRQIFQVPKQGTIAGSYVLSGTVLRSASARVIRDGVVVYDGKIGSLRRFKDDVKEVQAGYECGVGIENFNDLKVGDVVEVYTQEKVAAKL